MREKTLIEMTRKQLLKCLIAPAAIALLAGACKPEQQYEPVKDPNSIKLLADTVKVTVDKNTVLLTSSLELGVTYMQHNLDSWNNAASVQRGKTLLTGAVKYHNQHIFGFGASSPNPRPGVYNWGSLDERVALMTSMSATPVITLATAPTWMTDATWYAGKYANDPNGDDNGDTYWGGVEWAPLPAREADFASLCAKVAARYPNVKYFQVWNELKSMWHDAGNHWDYERYTGLYNKVYDSVKKVRPDALIGGPYVVMDSWINPPGGANSSISDPAYGTIDQRCLDVVTYWLQNKKGADFLCLDAWGDANDNSNLDVFAATKKFKDISTWLHSKTTLPIWWAEDYIQGGTDTLRQPAALACMLAYHALGGDAVSLRWSPESQDGNDNDSNLFTSTQVASTNGRPGGSPFQNYYLYRDFTKFFPKGTKLYKTTVSSGNVMVVSSATKAMLINKTSSSQKVKINNSLNLTLQPYQVYFSTLP